MSLDEDCVVFDKYGSCKDSTQNDDGISQSEEAPMVCFMEKLLYHSFTSVTNAVANDLKQVAIWSIPAAWYRISINPFEAKNLKGPYFLRMLMEDEHKLSLAKDGRIRELSIPCLPLSLIPVSSSRHEFISDRNVDEEFLMQIGVLHSQTFSQLWFKVPFDRTSFFGQVDPLGCDKSLQIPVPNYMRENCSRCLKKLTLHQIPCQACMWACYCNDKCLTKHIRIHKKTCSLIQYMYQY